MDAPENPALRPFEGVYPRLGARVYVDPAACVIGRVTVGDDSSIWPFVAVRGDVEEITIGPRCNVQDGAVLHVTHDGPYTPGGRGLVLGEGVTVAHGAMLHACTVGDYCLVGIGAIVLDGAVLEPGCMVAAGALVPPGARLTSGMLWRGSPARAARELTADERDNLRYSAEHYVRVKDRHLGSEKG